MKFEKFIEKIREIQEFRKETYRIAKEEGVEEGSIGRYPDVRLTVPIDGCGATEEYFSFVGYAGEYVDCLDYLESPSSKLWSEESRVRFCPGVFSGEELKQASLKLKKVIDSYVSGGPIPYDSEEILGVIRTKKDALKDHLLTTFETIDRERLSTKLERLFRGHKARRKTLEETLSTRGS
jgi:hypothetical protein